MILRLAISFFVLVLFAFPSFAWKPLVPSGAPSGVHWGLLRSHPEMNGPPYPPPNPWDNKILYNRDMLSNNFAGAFINALTSWHLVSSKYQFYYMCAGSAPECPEGIEYDVREVNLPGDSRSAWLDHGSWIYDSAKDHTIWGVMVGGGIAADTQVTLVNAAVAGGWTDAQKNWLLAHELGHLMGLDDLCPPDAGDASVSVMWKDNCTDVPSDPLVAPGSDDEAGINAIYDHEPVYP